MTTGGSVIATYLGLGANDQSKNYSKEFVMQPVTDASTEAEVATLMTRAATIAEAYAACTKGLMTAVTLRIDVPFTPVAAEAGAYPNRAAAVAGTIDGDPSKKFTAWIQAARDLLFIGNSGDSSIIDVADPVLINYFGSLNFNCLVSDGEVPHEDPVAGYRVDKKYIGRD